MWVSTWPESGKTAYREHATEAQAEAHAAELVKSGRATVATVFQDEGFEESA